MIIDTHCHFDMMPNPELYLKSQEAMTNISIGMTNPSANHYHVVPIHGHTASAANTGSGDAENIPPYEAFYVYKRTA